LQRVVEFFGGCPCEAVSGTSFTYEPLDPLAGEEMTFTGSALGSLPIAFDWDFGDGGTSSGEVVTHTYMVGGDYTVALTATNTCGFESVSQGVTVLNPPNIVVPRETIEEILLPGETSTQTLPVGNDGDLNLTFSIAETPLVDWLVVDPSAGELLPDESLTTTLTFDTGALPLGAYTATLEVSSNDPDEPLITLPVTMIICSPVGDTDFSWTPEAPLAGEVVTFTASVTGSEPISYFWEFSDGITSTAESPARTFAPGVYTVTLTTSNNCGVDNVTYTITIAAPPWLSHLPLVSKK